MVEQLRIGNFIRAKSPEKKEWVEDHRVTAHTLYSMEYPTAIDIVKPDIEPIPITVEWLERLGFKKRDGVFEYIYVHEEEDWISIDVSDNLVELSDRWIDKKFNYVHELQNLYFALTGKELTIKSH